MYSKPLVEAQQSRVSHLQLQRSHLLTTLAGCSLHSLLMPLLQLFTQAGKLLLSLGITLPEGGLMRLLQLLVLSL